MSVLYDAGALIAAEAWAASALSADRDDLGPLAAKLPSPVRILPV